MHELGGMSADLSPLGMVLAADAVVKGVIGLLLLASVATWTVFLAKCLEVAAARRRAARLSGRLRQAPSLALAVAAGEGRGAAAELLRAAEEEARASQGLPAGGVRERVAMRLQRVEAAGIRRLGRGTGLLATVGSTAPFIGLFGTVWGIMNSFVGIAEAQTTNLAVVAPGIAEALLATALGLVAAIPAVVFYNILARAIAGCRAELADLSTMVQVLLGRDLDREAPPVAAAR